MNVSYPLDYPLVKQWRAKKRRLKGRDSNEQTPGGIGIQSITFDLARTQTKCKYNSYVIG